MGHDDVSATQHTVTRDVATWVAGSEATDVPDQVRDRARLLTLDGLGCAVHGATQEWARIMADFVVSHGGAQEAQIWGTAQRVPAALAPLANGTAMHAFEYDDLHPGAVLHAGAQVLPVAFAVAELRERLAGSVRSGGSTAPVPATPATGAEFLHAIVIGFEVGAQIGLATGAGQLARGFHPSPNTATFAAAATASRLLHLDAEQTADALGIAGSFGGYLMAAQYGAMVKRVHPGHAGQSGLGAALLAARGLTGTEAVLEAPYGGFASAYGDAAPGDLDGIPERLGSAWEIPSYSIKYYPCCGSNHTALDAWWAVQRRGGLEAADVDSIELRCSTLTADHVGWPYAPGSITTAQMNLSYCLAAASVRGRLTVEEFAPHLLSDPAILDMVRRIRIRADPAIDDLGRGRRHLVHLQVSTRDGRSHTETVEFPKGSAGSPISLAEIIGKFRQLTEPRLSTRQVCEVEAQILGLGSTATDPFAVQEFTQLLTP